MTAAIKTSLAWLVLLDGLTSALLGHRFMSWLVRRLPVGLNWIPRLFLRVPEPLFRIGALLQAFLGFRLLRQPTSGHRETG